ncbi:Ig-like domain-containing protein [Myxococcota bacterium]|nr:Ig-like domain-containing protein [Myxococcota bacterium]
MRTAWILLLALACDGKVNDDTAGTDGGGTDGGGTDGGGTDGGGVTDGGGTDGGVTDGGGTDGGGTDGGGDGGTDCTATVESFRPTSGSVGVPLDTTVSATLRGSDATAVIELYAASGERVDGALHTEEGLVAFTPSAPLLPDTGYQATMEWCGGYEVWSFVTVDDDGMAGDPTGNVYHLDLAGASWIEPASVGPILAGTMSNLLLLKVLSYGTEVEIRLAWSDEAGLRQDLCLQTVDEVVTDVASLPAFALGPADGTLVMAGEALVLRDRWLTASFAADLGELEEASLGGTADMRDWIDVLGPSVGTDDPAELCDLLASFGPGCETCADGEISCLELRGERIPAEAGWIKVEKRSAEDIAADPRCH